MLFAIICFIFQESRKNKIEQEKQNRIDASSLLPTNQGNTQNIDNLKDSIDKINDFLQNDYQSPDQLFQRLSSTINQLETSQDDKLSQFNKLHYQMISSVNQSVISHSQTTNELINSLNSKLINEIHLQNEEINNIYEFINQALSQLTDINNVNNDQSSTYNPQDSTPDRSE